MILSVATINFLQQKINDKKQIEKQQLDLKFRNIQNYLFINYVKTGIVDSFFTKQKKEMRDIFFLPFILHLHIINNEIHQILHTDVIYDMSKLLHVTVVDLLNLHDKYKIFIYSTITYSCWFIKIHEVDYSKVS